MPVMSQSPRTGSSISVISWLRTSNWSSEPVSVAMVTTPFRAIASLIAPYELKFWSSFSSEKMPSSSSNASSSP